VLPRPRPRNRGRIGQPHWVRERSRHCDRLASRRRHWPVQRRKRLGRNRRIAVDGRRCGAGWHPGDAGADMIPGDVVAAAGEVVLNPDPSGIVLTVANTGDRPIQVGSHYHFAETNAALAFDRRTALGHRLDIPAGTAVRFDPASLATYGWCRTGALASS